MDRKYSVGFSILELSKLAMFQCFYEVIQPRFGKHNVDILLSDTDSFILHIKNHTKEEARHKLKDVMDFSNLHPSNSFFNETRKNVPGYLKDETPNGSIVECIALKSKCYLIRTRNELNNRKDDIIDKKCKGITKPRVKRLKIANYRKCVTSIHVVKGTMARISVKKHQIRTVTQNKICLSSFDDKRFMLHCGKHSRAYRQEPMSNKCHICNF